MGTILKIQLSSAIVKADIGRIAQGERPINNINGLSTILAAEYPNKYKSGNIGVRLYNVRNIGLKREDSKQQFNSVLDDVCSVLKSSKEELIYEVSFKKRMGGILKIRLNSVIIKADAVRIEQDKSPIKNIPRLSAILEARHPDKYEYESVLNLLYKGNRTGFKRSDSKQSFNRLVDDLCRVLEVSKEALVYEVE